MRVLLTGSSGQAGRAIAATAPDDARLTQHSHQSLDITDRDAVNSAIGDADAQIVINAAAYTDVDGAESNAEVAHAVNATGAENLALGAADAGARVIHLSTDYVFDGSRPQPLRVTDPVAPLNVYGVSKLAGEKAVRDALPTRSSIIRTSWLYYQHGQNFVHTMLRLMRENAQVRVVADQVGAPTWAASLARAVWAAALDEDVHGVMHWRDAGVASWYDFASAIAEIGSTLGLLNDGVEVVPVTTAEFPTRANRPGFSLLSVDESANRLGIVPEHWRTNLRHMLEQLTHA
ncbi:MAG: dTDP-4-dehydrorhamnose reductase [Pseudomonadota bacterium]